MITINFLISNFLFFRYVRANRTIILFLIGFFFTIVTVYESYKYNILLFTILFLWASLQISIAYLKEKGNVVIKNLQEGYQPIETVIHFGCFFLIVFFVLFIHYLLFGWNAGK